MGDLWRENGLVFASEIGTHLNRHNLAYRSFKPLLKRAELPNIRFHDLRHTCATLLLSKGVHPKFVQELLGHSDIRMTLVIYTHATDDMQDAATDALEQAFSGSSYLRRG